jgi:phosphatidylserine/phosphatidylglycerophosphate/cardiolipin synthase-like enzyme
MGKTPTDVRVSFRKGRVRHAKTFMVDGQWSTIGSMNFRDAAAISCPLRWRDDFL